MEAGRMNLQISFIGVAIIAVYSLAVLLVIAWPLSRLLRNWRWKWLLIVPLVLPLLAAPWAEEVWIAWHFQKACKDAGVHVYRTVEVEGFYDATGSGYSKPGPLDYKPAIQSFEERNFRFYERLVGYDPHANPLRVDHVEKINDQWIVTLLDRPTARYFYKRAYQPTPHVYEEPVGWKLSKSETLVVDVQTNTVLGRDVSYTRRPNIAEWQLLRFFGSGGRSCPDPEKGPFQPPFPESVLIPVKK
jgi:hypothetical protein